MKATLTLQNDFSGRILTAAVFRAQKKVLLHQGAILRRAMRQQIRTRRSPSKPGQPPTNQTGILKNSIRFAYVPFSQSVVVGPVKLSGSTNAPGVLEHGGVVPVPKVFRYRRFAPGAPGNDGGIGPVKILSTEDYDPYATKFGVGTLRREKGYSRREYQKWERYVDVIWRRLRTEKEARHANIIYSALMSLRGIHLTTKTTGRLERRPYASRALLQCQEALILAWKNALTDKMGFGAKR